MDVTERFLDVLRASPREFGRKMAGFHRFCDSVVGELVIRVNVDDLPDPERHSRFLKGFLERQKDGQHRLTTVVGKCSEDEKRLDANALASEVRFEIDS